MAKVRVFVDGAFDLLHPNHVKFLENAKALGDHLIVCVMSNVVMESYKRTPIMDENERLAMIKALKVVDEAFILFDPLKAETLAKILDDYKVDKVVYSGGSEYEFYQPAIDRNIMVKPSYLDGVSTTAIIKRVLNNKNLNIS